jgi:hypothetical protein
MVVLGGRGGSYERGSPVPASLETAPPHRRALGKGLLPGPRSLQFLVSEVPLYRTGPPRDVSLAPSLSSSTEGGRSRNGWAVFRVRVWSR